MAERITCNCDGGDHLECGGYVAPLVYSDRVPCACICHLDGPNGRPYQPRTKLLSGETLDAYRERARRAVRV